MRSTALLILAVSINGCLVFNTVSYDIKLNDDRSGNVSIFIKNIKSDAKNNVDFEADKNNLFNYMLKSDEFVTSMSQNSGKRIIERNLFTDGNKLNGSAVYEFDNIIGIENIQYEDNFYFLNLTLEDSVISTNGEIIKSKDFKRILWDEKMKNLKFEMFSSSLRDSSYKELAPFLKK